jgi:hypothetical protein
MKTNIKQAAPAIYKNWLGRRYGNASMAKGYIEALEYAKAVHHTVDPYVPVFGPIAAEIRATIDEDAYFKFINAHADELRLERQCQQRHATLAEWGKGPSAAEIAAQNQAAYAADGLEIEIRQRTEQILQERARAAEISARAQALKEASTEVRGR